MLVTLVGGLIWGQFTSAPRISSRCTVASVMTWVAGFDASGFGAESPENRFQVLCLKLVPLVLGEEFGKKWPNIADLNLAQFVPVPFEQPCYIKLPCELGDPTLNKSRSLTAQTPKSRRQSLQSKSSKMLSAIQNRNRQ